MSATHINPITGGVTPSRHEISVESKLTQHYRLETPVSVTGQIIVTADRDGELVVFSVGTNNNVFCFRPDVTSETGWSQVSIGLTGAQIAAGRDRDGNLVVFTPDGGALNYVQEQPHSGWGTPRTIKTATPITYVKARNVGDRLYVRPPHQVH